MNLAKHHLCLILKTFCLGHFLATLNTQPGLDPFLVEFFLICLLEIDIQIVYQTESPFARVTDRSILLSQPDRTKGSVWSGLATDHTASGTTQGKEGRAHR